MPVERVDTVVLGAGVNGMSIAYELCKRKKRVAVIDKVVMGAGASGSCDDMILLQSKKPGILLEMAFRSLELFKGLERELPTDIEFENRGGTILIEKSVSAFMMEELRLTRTASAWKVGSHRRPNAYAELQPLVFLLNVIAIDV
jgi:sarcosine oxidase subunit beta